MNQTRFALKGGGGQVTVAIGMVEFGGSLDCDSRSDKCETADSEREKKETRRGDWVRSESYSTTA